MRKAARVGAFVLASLVMAITIIAQTQSSIGNVLLAENSPLKIGNAEVKTSKGQSIVTYSVTNSSEKVIRDYKILTKVYDSKGRVRASDMHLINEPMNPGQRTDKAFIFQGDVTPAEQKYVLSSNDTLIITVLAVRGPNWTWQLDRAEASAALKKRVTGGTVRLTGVYNTDIQYNHALQSCALYCGTDWCTNCRNDAHVDCQGHGVKTFHCSCSDQTCTCDYTCRD